MASSLSGALLGAGIAAGAADIPFYTARLQEAQARAKMSQLQAQDYERQAPMRDAQSQAQLAQMQQALYTTQTQLAKQQSYDAFTRYRTDGDAKHLNQWLEQNRSNPVAAGITGDMARMDRVTRTPENDKILQAAGITDLDGFYEHPEVNGSFVMGTTSDGHKALIDMNRMYAVTGYTQQLTDDGIKKLSTTAALVGGLRNGANLRGLQADSALVQQVSQLTGQSPSDVYTMLQPDPKAGLDYAPMRASGGGGGSGRGGTAIERLANQFMSDDPEMTLRDAYSQAVGVLRGGSRGGGSGETQFIDDYMSRNPDATREDALAEYRTAGKDQRTSAMRNTEYGEEAKQELDKNFNGDFLSADLNNLDGTQRRVVDQQITRLERVAGLKFSAADNKQIRDITKTINTAGFVAKNLDDAQTGILDSTTNMLRTYVDNGSVKSKQATLAYNTLGAFMRDGLFGKQVSAADRRDMNKVWANLGQQTGPVLASMKQSLSSSRDTLASLQQLGDPYVAKARTGMSIEQLDNTIAALDNRINLLDRASANGATGGTSSGIQVHLNSTQPGGMTTANPAVSGERPSLSDIFGGSQ